MNGLSGLTFSQPDTCSNNGGTHLAFDERANASGMRGEFKRTDKAYTSFLAATAFFSVISKPSLLVKEVGRLSSFKLRFPSSPYSN